MKDSGNSQQHGPKSRWDHGCGPDVHHVDRGRQELKGPLPTNLILPKLYLTCGEGAARGGRI